MPSWLAPWQRSHAAERQVWKPLSVKASTLVPSTTLYGAAPAGAAAVGAAGVVELSAVLAVGFTAAGAAALAAGPPFRSRRHAALALGDCSASQ